MHLELVPATRLDAPAWLRWRNEQSSLAHNPVLSLGLDELARRLDGVSADLTDPSVREYRWIVMVDGAKVGTVALVNVSWSMGYGEVAYHIGERHQGRGLGRAAVRLLVDHVFGHSELRRLMALVAVDNLPSRRLAESLGFVHEGTLRHHFVVDGRPVDEAIYAVLRSEWRPEPPDVQLPS